MTELRLPAELQQRLQQEAEAFELPVADFLQLMLNSYQLWAQGAERAIGEDFEALLSQAEKAHAHLLTLTELRS